MRQSGIKRVKWLRTLLNRYYGGKANDRERRIVEEWIPTAGEEESGLDRQVAEERCDEIWRRLENRCLGEDLNRRRKRRSIRVVYYAAAVAAAASLLLMIGIPGKVADPEASRSLGIGFEDADTRKEYIVATDSIRKLTLPDGSRICLNEGTRLAYQPERFNLRSREVWLEEGEAFFEVCPDPSRAFTVYHGSMRTIVRGTSFNIRSYKSLGEEVVAVRSGRVEVRTDTLLVGSLKRGEAILWNRATGHLTHAGCSDDDLMAWMEHRLVLRHASVAELGLRIKQLYNKDLVVEDNALPEMRLSVAFPPRCPLENVVSVLAELYGVSCRVEGDLLIFSRHRA